MGDDLKEEIRLAFDHVAKNRYDSIGQKELTVVLRILGQNPTAAEVQDLMKEMDSNKNGAIELDEFEACFIKVRKSPQETVAELSAAFKILDKNGKGFLRSEMLKILVTSVGEKLTQEEADDLNRTIDKNGDGKIDYEEIAVLMSNYRK